MIRFDNDTRTVLVSATMEKSAASRPKSFGDNSTDSFLLYLTIGRKIVILCSNYAAYHKSLLW